MYACPWTSVRLWVWVLVHMNDQGTLALILKGEVSAWLTAFSLLVRTRLFWNWRKNSFMERCSWFLTSKDKEVSRTDTSPLRIKVSVPWYGNRNPTWVVELVVGVLPVDAAGQLVEAVHVHLAGDDEHRGRDVSVRSDKLENYSLTSVWVKNESWKILEFGIVGCNQITVLK